MVDRQSTLEDLVMSFWQGRRVLLTGHTGFKGAWLSLWLQQLGAQVTGLALEPETDPALFTQLGLADRMDHHILDVRNAEGVAQLVRAARPDVVLHLAAQPLVLRGYSEPVETWNVNVLGTIHLLEALRSLGSPCAAVMVTTDKVYENREWEFGYREDDTLGGHDPYSASKAAAEIAVSCWRRSFLSDKTQVRVATARAGNVIGGGDWSEYRIVPDIARAFGSDKPIEVRNRHATRPWQHVLEPLSGYMRLAQALSQSEDQHLQDAFNFGPEAEASRTVGDLVAECVKHWPGPIEDVSPPNAPHEASNLSLTIDRARERLNWTPRWNVARGVKETMIWYRSAQELDTAGLRELSLGQIRAFEDEAREAH